MQSSTYPGGNLYISLGERRGRSDLAPSLDLSWARAASDCSYSRAYPSPPMSGSPPLPPRSNPEPSSRDLGSYASAAQDLVPRQQAPQQEYHDRGMGPPLQTFQERPHSSYAPYRPDDMTQQFAFQQPLPQPLQQHQHLHQQTPLQPPIQHIYAPQGQSPFSPERPRMEHQVLSPSKAQRKTKGHVASACVPCKRAHLRCDAQRPCSRCLTNGKEDSCVDVQHKKRGRPRLRDEREPRYEILGPNYPPPPDSMSRRPLMLYSDTPYARPGENHQVPGGYRVLKSQSGMSPISPRHMEHTTSPIDARIYGSSMPPTPRMFAPQEPICAYLNMEMQVTKVSSGFSETIGVQSVLSRKLQDIVSLTDRDKVSRLQELLEEEKREREPNYLPPIYLKIEEDRLIQSVSFGPEEMAQFRLDRQERITFQGPDGQQRAFQARIGLSKKESTYFIVLLLDLPTTPQIYMPQSSYSSDTQYGFMPPQQAPHPAQSPYMSNPTFGDQRMEMSAYRAPAPLASNVPPSMHMPTYTQTPMRQDYVQSQNQYQSPRPEMPQTQPPPQARPQGQGHDLQLPPIRGQHPTDPSQRRDDRSSSRVDIGGLLEKRDHAGRGH